MNRREFVVASSCGLVTLVFSGAAQDQKQYICPPCGCSKDEEVFKEPGACPSCKMALIEKTSELRGIINFTKVTDQVWMGGQPLAEHLLTLKDAGVKIIINLRPHGEHNGAVEANKVKELGLSYFNIPVSGREPDELDVDEFLKITDEQLKNGRVFIHDSGGARAALFWLIRRVLRDGWELDKALEEASKMGLRSQSPLVTFAKEYIEKKKKK